MFARVIILVLAGILTTYPVKASDMAREQRYAVAIQRTLTLGEALTLQDGENDFLALYTESDALKAHGAVILLHARGAHPEQQNVIHALRIKLPEHHWNTLAIQLPLRESNAKPQDYYALFPEAVSRIQAAIDYLKRKNIQNIVLLGYGMGALMALNFQNTTRPKTVKAMVAISLGVPKTEVKAVQTLTFLQQLQLPILDIYAALDVPEVTGSARKRRLAAKQNLNYRQLRIDDADHHYRHDEALLIKRVYSWLSVALRQPAGQ